MLYFTYDNYKQNSQLESCEDSDKKRLLATRSAQKMDEILRRKRSLTLNLKRALPASPDKESVETGMDPESESSRRSRKKKIAESLHFTYPEQFSSPSDTYETFHTAVADTPEIRFPEESSLKLESSEPIEGIEIANDLNAEEFVEEACELKESNSADDNLNSDAKPASNKEEEENSILEFLKQRIAAQTIVVMKCLQQSPTPTDELNHEIAILQDLQKQQIQLEASLQEEQEDLESRPQNFVTGNSCSLNASPLNKRNQSARSSITSSTLSLANSAVMKSRTRSRHSTDDDNRSRTSAVSRNPNGRGYSSVYLTVSKFSGFNPEEFT